MQKPLNSTKSDACRDDSLSVERYGNAPFAIDAADRSQMVFSGVAAFAPEEPAEDINGECYGRQQKTGYATGWDNRCNGVRAGWEEDSR